MGEEASDGVASRPRQRRERRAREFLEAAQHIVFREGFDGLTMHRLARELDTVDSAVYRYFPSKGAIIAEVQREAIERLGASLARLLDTTRERLDAAGEPAASLTRAVLVGRWFCACAERYPEEMRLFGMIMSRQASALDSGGGERIYPAAMDFLGRAVGVLHAAQEANALAEGNAVERAVIWASGVNGVLQTDDLEAYAPELFGGARLARRASLDLLAGWGADRAALGEADRLIDDLATTVELAP